MSSGGPAASSSGWFIRPREPGTGSADCVGRTQNFSLTGPYAMAPAEHREPCESRGSCTVLGAPGGEIPPGDSTGASIDVRSVFVCWTPYQLTDWCTTERPGGLCH